MMQAVNFSSNEIANNAMAKNENGIIVVLCV